MQRVSPVRSEVSIGNFPIEYPQQDLPSRISIVEVAPRDGLQAVEQFISTGEKIRFIKELSLAGLRTIEPTSMVSSRRVPQFSDADEIVKLLSGEPGQYPVLVPNAVGLNRAIDAGARTIAVFVSASDSFAQRNLGMRKEEAIKEAEAVIEVALARGITVRGYISMCFGDPWEGPTKPSEVAIIAKRLLGAGCYEVSLGDTIGVATAGHVKSLVETHLKYGVPVSKLALHFHDTYGQAVSNVYAALECGITTFDSSSGGIGGCPFAKSATGNVSTEELLWLMKGLGIQTGVDLEAVCRAGRQITDRLGSAPSKLATALLPS